jgi:hypothetical protein
MKIKKANNKSLYYGKYSMCYRAVIPLLYYAKVNERKPYEVARLDLSAMVDIQRRAAARLSQENVPHYLTVGRVVRKLLKKGESVTDGAIDRCFDDIYRELLWLLRFFLEKGDYKVSVSTDNLYVYTNDQAVVDSLKSRGHDSASLTVIEHPVPPGEVRLVESKYSFRSKLNARIFTPTEKEALERYIENADAHPSAALSCWFRDHRSLKSMRYFYIDHNSTDILTLISLIKPGLVSRTSKITVVAK